MAKQVFRLMMKRRLLNYYLNPPDKRMGLEINEAIKSYA